MIKLTNKVIIVALTGIICVSVGCFSAKVRMDPDFHIVNGKATLYPGLAYKGAADDTLEKVWRVGDFPLSFAVDTAMLPFDAIYILATRDGGKTQKPQTDTEKEAVRKEAERLKKQQAAEKAADIKEIASVLKRVEGIGADNATILYEADLTFPDPLSTTAATDIVLETGGKVDSELAKAIAAAVKEEVDARALAAAEKAAAKRLKAIKDFTSVATIDLADAQKIYDEKIFEGFEELDAATTVELRDAGLAEDLTEAEELKKEIDDEGMARAERKADKLEEKAVAAVEKAAAAAAAAETAQNAADAAQNAAETAKTEAADAAEKAETAKKAAEAARKDFPELETEEKNNTAPPDIKSPNKGE